MTDEPIVPDLARVRTAAERDAVNQRILDDLTADHPDLDGALAGPVYPEAMGAVLGKLFAAEPTPGPPWVHTIEPPRCDLEDCCETDEPCGCACHRVQPTHTVTTIEPYDLTAEPVAFVEIQGSSDSDSLDYGGPLNLLPPRRGVELPCSIHPGRTIGENGCPRCREIRDHQLGRDA